MKVFVAGATGAIGRRLVPLLVSRGHEVVGMTRSTAKRQMLRDMGAEPVFADGLDRAAVMAAVARAEPEVVIHQMTALSDIKSVRRWDHEFAVTNRLRTEGLDHLLEAARAVGARRFVAQSFGNWDYERSGGAVKTEEDPLDPAPPATMSRTLAAIRHVESAVLGQDDIEGVVLRYGNLYGPAEEMPSFLETIRKGQLPIVGDGGGVWSFVHLADAAAATALALEPGAAGIYNVVDDDPAPVSVWLPELATVLGARPPRHVPVWFGRLAAGAAGVSLFTEIRGASNEKAKRELGWELLYPSWRDGFRRAIEPGAATRVSGEHPTNLHTTERS
jgi:nucleoside-diphosphate-sugar epimerase